MLHQSNFILFFFLIFAPYSPGVITLASCVKIYFVKFQVVWYIFHSFVKKKRERLGAWIFFKLNFEIITMKPKLFEVFTRQVPVSMFLKVYFCRSFCSIEIMSDLLERMLVIERVLNVLS